MRGCSHGFSPSPSAPLCLCGECQRPWHHKTSPLARGALATSRLVRIHHRDTEAQRGTESSQITYKNDLEMPLETFPSVRDSQAGRWADHPICERGEILRHGLGIVDPLHRPLLSCLVQ